MFFKHNSTIHLSLVLLIALVFLFGVSVAFAQDNGVEEGVRIFENFGFTNVDPRVIVARIIQVFLGLLATIALGIVLYGGFLWMFSSGDSTKLSRARLLLVQGAVGLAIILSSVTIVTFILNALIDATGANGGTGPSGGGPVDPSLLYAQKTGHSPPHHETTDPAPGNTVIRNSVVRIFTSQVIDQGTVESTDVQVFKIATINPDNDIDPDALQTEKDGVIAVRGKSLEWVPGGPCIDAFLNPVDVDRDGTTDPGDGSMDPDDVVCFESFTRYEVRARPGSMFTADGKEFKCDLATQGQDASCIWRFNTNDIIDTDDPNIDSVNFKDVAGNNVLQGNRYIPDDYVYMDVTATDSTSYVSMVVSDIQGTRNDGTPYTHSLSDSYDGDDVFALPWDMENPDNLQSGENYALTFTATDADSHTDTLRKDVTLRAAHCFNTLWDGGETGIDCGGPDCGACNGNLCGVITQDVGGNDVCTNPVNEVCRSGFCDSNTCRCADRPVIQGIIPDSGDIGTWVTIWGFGFGEGPGTVNFLYDYDRRNDLNLATPAASLPADCGATWNDSQIVVEVPHLKDADGNPLPTPISESSRIQVIAANGRYDVSTADDYGDFDSGFTYTEEVRPGLCKIHPRGDPAGEARGSLNQEMTGIGKSFVLNPRSVIFGADVPSEVVSWNDLNNPQTVDFKVPNLQPRLTSVKVEGTDPLGTVQESNPLEFTVEAVPEALLPRITEIDSPEEDDPTFPEGVLGWGGPDQMITIRGLNFGNEPGTVEFIFDNGLGDRRTGLGHNNGMPEMCLVQYWDDNQIVIKVPEKYQDNTPVVANSAHNVKVTTNDGRESDPAQAQFMVRDTQPNPGICAIIPDNGPANGMLTFDLWGERFGASVGNVFFSGSLAPFDIIPVAPPDIWMNEQIQTKVPAGEQGNPNNRTATGPVKMKNVDTLKESNTVQFTVQDCRVQGEEICDIAGGEMCCGDGTCRPESDCAGVPSAADYVGWAMSTGKFPLPFQMVTQCQVNDPTVIPSPSPAERWQTLVCTNVRVQAMFNQALNPLTVNPTTVTVETCGTGDTPDDGYDSTQPCGMAPAPVELEDPFSFIEIGGDDVGFATDPLGPDLWISNTWHRVRLFNQIQSAGADPLFLDGNRDGWGSGLPEDDIVWYFKTGVEQCRLTSVVVTPPEATVQPGEEQDFLGNPGTDGNRCVNLIGDLLAWQWDSSNAPESPLPFIAVIDPPSNTHEATAKAQEREGHAIITATADQDFDGDGFFWGDPDDIVASGKADLFVKNIVPEILEKWPDCGAACVNAQIGMRWNVEIDTSFINDTYFKLFEFTCGNGRLEAGEDCDDGNLASHDGCSDQCQNEGTTTCTAPDANPNYCCGNGRIDHPANDSMKGGEQCDGDPIPGYCDASNCLFNGTSPTCGNGIVEIGEACDEGGPTPTCTGTCLHISPGQVTEVVVSSVDDPIGDQKVISFTLIDPDGPGPLAGLTPNTAYCVAIDRNVTSNKNVRIYRNGDPVWQDVICAGAITGEWRDAIVWSFSTKNDPSLCSVDRVQVFPDEAVVTVIGDPQLSQATYFSAPFGEPDECSVNGQVLNPFDYGWSWQTVNDEGNFDIEVARIVGGPPGQNFYPSCGNFMREYAEDSDYGQCQKVLPFGGSVKTERACNEDMKNTLCREDTDPLETTYNCIAPGNDHDYLSDLCLNKGGSLACGGGKTTNCCGNRVLEIGEDCDDGNHAEGDGCSGICLAIGYEFTCGNGRVDIGSNIREECDDGKQCVDGASCTLDQDCASIPNPDKTCKTRLGDGCSTRCLNEGTVTDSLIDPIQKAEAVGMRQEDVEQGYSRTKVQAVEQDSSEGDTGVFTLQCEYNTDTECDALTPGFNNDLGLGADSCCYPRATFTENPTDGATDVCRNTALTARFSEEMDTGSFIGNMILLRRYDEGCPEGMDEFSFADASHAPEQPNLFERIWHWVKKIVLQALGRKAEAIHGVPHWCTMIGGVSSPDIYTAKFTPFDILGEDAVAVSYKVVLESGADGAGVKTAKGVSLGARQEWGFTAGTKVCEINQVDVEIVPFNMSVPVDPSNPSANAGIKTSDFFFCNNPEAAPDVQVCKDDVAVDVEPKFAGTQHRYHAVARNSDHSEALDAEYQWQGDPEAAGKIKLKKTDLTDLPEENNEQTVFTQIGGDNDNFQTFVVVNAQSPDTDPDPNREDWLGICPDGAPCFAGEVCTDGTSCARLGGSQQVDITTFICENPWPPLAEFPFDDSGGPDRAYPTDPERGSYTTMDFRTYYCRDAGVDGIAEDLPEVKTVNLTPLPDPDYNTFFIADGIDSLQEEYIFEMYSGYCAVPDADDATIPINSGTGRGCDITNPCPGGEVCFEYGFCNKSKKMCADWILNSTCPAGETCLSNNDAIGFRIYENEQHLSPLAWYQKNGFRGSPNSTNGIDGFSTAQDGSTLYVNAPYIVYPNRGICALDAAMSCSSDARCQNADPDPANICLFYKNYTGMYITSLTPEAVSSTTNVFQQLISNFDLGIEYTNVKACAVSGEVCSKDIDCNYPSDPNDLCLATKDKVRRDVVRMENIRDMETAANRYRIAYDTYPPLSSGTYIQGNSISVWPSWQSTLAKTLGVASLFTDPINLLINCAAGTDPKTCWDEQTLQMDCPDNWWTYGYKFVNQERAHFYTNFEETSLVWREIEIPIGGEAGVLQACGATLPGGGARIDSDRDGVFDEIDNCPSVKNGYCGEAPFLECDVDKNGIINNVRVRALNGRQGDDPAALDNEVTLGGQNDTDSDHIGDACDPCWIPLSNSDIGHDNDHDEWCSLFDEDNDNCPITANMSQNDYDIDAKRTPPGSCNYDTPPPYQNPSLGYCGGDTCDLDADSDGFTKNNDCQESDTFPGCHYVPQPYPTQTGLYVTLLDAQGLRAGKEEHTPADEAYIALYEGFGVFDEPLSGNVPVQVPIRLIDIKNIERATFPMFPLVPGRGYTLRLHAVSGKPYTERGRPAKKDLGFKLQFWSPQSITVLQTRTYTAPREECVGIPSSTLGAWPEYKGTLCFMDDTPRGSGGFVDYKIMFFPDSKSYCSQWVHPGALEVCDGVDNDCNGVTDRVSVYECSISKKECVLGVTEPENPDNPDAPEGCYPEEGVCQLARYKNLCAPDNDNDGFSLDDGDCNDIDPLVFPDGSETHTLEDMNPGAANDLCKDGKDNDCDGFTDWQDVRTDTGHDGDGKPDCKDDDNDDWADFQIGIRDDCDDTNPAIHPGVREDCDDVLDNDCSGEFDLGDTNACNVGERAAMDLKLCDIGTADDSFEIELTPYSGGDSAIIAIQDIRTLVPHSLPDNGQGTGWEGRDPRTGNIMQDNILLFHLDDLESPFLETSGGNHDGLATNHTLYPLHDPPVGDRPLSVEYGQDGKIRSAPVLDTIGQLGETAIRVSGHRDFAVDDALSVFAWIKPENTGSSQTIISQFEWYMTYRHPQTGQIKEIPSMIWSFRQDGKRLSLVLGQGNSNSEPGGYAGRVITNTDVLQKGVWQHVGFTFQGGAERTYDRGEEAVCPEGNPDSNSFQGGDVTIYVNGIVKTADFAYQSGDYSPCEFIPEHLFNDTLYPFTPVEVGAENLLTHIDWIVEHRDTPKGYYYFLGGIDEVAMWKRVLPQSEINFILEKQNQEEYEDYCVETTGTGFTSGRYNLTIRSRDTIFTPTDWASFPWTALGEFEAFFSDSAKFLGFQGPERDRVRFMPIAENNSEPYCRDQGYDEAFIINGLSWTALFDASVGGLEPGEQALFTSRVGGLTCTADQDIVPQPAGGAIKIPIDLHATDREREQK